jgi:hypothetical protein
MREFLFILITSILFIIIVLYSGYNNPEKQKRERRLVEKIDPNYDKKYPKSF